MTQSPKTPTPVAPTRDDPLLRHLSERLGGPAGRRLRPRRSPAPLLLGLTLLGILLSALTSQYCRINGWGGVEVYHAGCYSDISALFAQRGLDDAPWGPLLGTGYFEYPVLTSLIAALLAAATRFLLAQEMTAALGWSVERGSLLYWDLSFAAAAVVWLVLVLVVMKAAGARPWDAAIVAVSPAVIFGIGINWDIWAVTAMALAILAFQRGAHLSAGVMIGVGVSFKLFPLFMLGAVLVLVLRRDTGLGFGVFLKVLGAAVVSWLILNLPAMALSSSAWSEFFELSAERGAGYSSPWYLWQLIAEGRGASGLSATAISGFSLGLFAAACAGILLLGLRAEHPARMVQLLFLIVAAFLLLNKVYSPQFMIWLVPLIALAAPRWRDALIWQGFQLLHFWAVWMHLAGIVGDHEAQHSFDTALYITAVLGHIGATLYLMIQVVLDILRPQRDPVRQVGRGPEPGAARTPEPRAARTPEPQVGRGPEPGSAPEPAPGSALR
ncbi:hypothetical protein [Nesterenkonia sandarakina]|uniref:Putative membrane protein n=1 Tax=Nesterenkonia sandarakina TaxID=272918 RepID=A0A7Z0J327_9MICC|nr:hypothetical protein [Nesterenkonia sandarakina]NYJ16384.1 putative membrane protein [Nesterenkonia sandarakina]